MYCPKCGKENPDDADFCMKCGEDLSGYKIEKIEERLRGVYPEKEVQKFVNSFRIILDIRSSYCNTETTLGVLYKALDRLKTHLKDEEEFMSEIENIERSLKPLSLSTKGLEETLDDNAVKELEYFCKKFIEMVIAKASDVSEKIQRLRETRIPDKSGINIKDSIIQKSTIQQIETYIDKNITKIELKPSQMENLVTELKQISKDVNWVDYLEDIALRAEMDGDNEKAAIYWELRAYYLEKEAMEFYHKGDTESLKLAEKSLGFAKLSLEKASNNYQNVSDMERQKDADELINLIDHLKGQPLPSTNIKREIRKAINRVSQKYLSRKIRDISLKIIELDGQIARINSTFWSAKLDENINDFYGGGR